MLIFVSISVNSKMMDMCCEAESKLATELMYHEVQLERDILEPLNQLAEVKHTHTINDEYITHRTVNYS